MGRRGRSDRGQRDDYFESLAELLAPPIEPLRPIDPLIDMLPLSEVEDGRRFDPYTSLARSVGYTSAHDQVGRAARLDVVRLPDVGPRWSDVGFSAPDTVARCIRRKTRREVMFATRRRRKGAGARRRRRNYWSNVRC